MPPCFRSFRAFLIARREMVLVSAVVATLSACGSVPLNEPVAPVATAPAASAPVARHDLPALPPAGSGRGAYYMDDGPGEDPPANLMDIPDAEPRVEPFTTRGNRPYVVFGKSYTPFVDNRPYKERGRGSWYGRKFHGQTTSSGEPYDMYKMTAAHPTMPLPSYARVTNLENGRQVIVRVNDRGPFVAGRIIDLSYTAALKLGYLERGSAMLEVERLLPEEIERMAAQRQQQLAAGGPAVAPSVEAVSVADAPLPERVELVALTPPPQPVAPEQAVIVSGSPAMPAAGFYLQLGAFGQAANAEAARARLNAQAGLALPPLEVVEQGNWFRVFSGPFTTRAAAEQAAQELQRRGAGNALIVQR